MINYNGQEALDPLIDILLQNNGIEPTGNPADDIASLEQAGALHIEPPVVGHLAIREEVLIDA